MITKLINQVMLLQHNESSDSRSYRVACACNDPDDDIWITADYDKKWGMVDLTFFKKLNFRDECPDAKSLIRVYEDLFEWLSELNEKNFKSVTATIRTLGAFGVEVIDGYYKWAQQYYNFFNRINKALRIVFTGYLEVESDFVVNDTDLKSFIMVLQDFYDESEKKKQEKLKEHNAKKTKRNIDK